jgi:hypothetical protein
MTDWHDVDSLDAYELLIDDWLARFATDNPVIAVTTSAAGSCE